MLEVFNILIDRLKGGQTQKIEESLSPTFLGPEEPELRFASNVEVHGETYVTDSHLIVHLKAHMKIRMPCAVCNQMIEKPLKVDDFYHTQALEEIPSAIFNYSEALREALLIELPRTVECNEGNCPDRNVMKAYIRSKPESDPSTYFPFNNLK
jgi:hypothetical protein